MDKYNIKGVEVFSAGKWNGDEYTKEDLIDMVKAFEETSSGIRPFLKLGHDNKQKILKSEGLPAAGWIEKLYIKGDKLVADFVDIPKKIFQLIESKAYRKVSSEIYLNVQIKEKKYNKLLGAVALLGAETPGVYNLSDILAMYNQQAQEVKIYDDAIIDIIYENETNKNKGVKMKTENEIKLELELKAKEDEAKKFAKQAEDAQKEADAQKEEIEQLKKFKAEAEAKQIKLEADAAQARIEKFSTELVAEQLCTPAMKPLIEALLGPEKKEYSVKLADKEENLTKENLLKEALKLFAAAKGVNLEEGSQAGKEKSEFSDKEMDEKIKKYAADNKLSYGQAAKEIMKQNKK